MKHYANLFILFIVFSLFVSLTSARAQKGIIRGTIIEDATGEPLFGVTVVIKGTTNGSITDFDGKFEINVEAGVVDIQASFISFETVVLSQIEVKPGDVTILDNIRMQEDVQTLEEVIVTAEVLKNSEEAILTIKKRSANVIDGISAANFRKIGDSDAAAAMKRVTGVSVQGGKYVYVRGLGDRYTKTILNDVDVPGLDPDRNTIQMDIFPTNVIDNIVVSKSFTADLPADFTGGIVNIETKEFPESKNLKVGIGLGFNPDMHFNSNYLKYEGGSTDFLGFDDGTRANPADGIDEIPFRADAIGDPDKARVFEGIINDFGPIMAAENATSFMNYSMSLSTGNQFSKDYGTVGYNFAITYKNNTEFYQDAEYSRWGLNQTDISDFEMELREDQKGDFGVNNVLLGGLAGLAFKTDQSKYKINLLHLQNGESKAGIFDYIGTDQGSNFEAIQHNLEYSQRSLSNLLLNGQHHSKDSRWVIDWKVSPTHSVMNDPDVRFTRLRTDGGSSDFEIGTETGFPARIWRNLNEQNIVGRVDVTRELLVMGNEAKLRFGGANAYKQRDYRIEDFIINTDRFTANNTLNGDPNQLFEKDNLWTTDNTEGVFYDPNFFPNNPNAFNSNMNILGGYTSLEFSPISNLKTIAGLRVEKFDLRYTGENQARQRFDNEKFLDDLDLFPTLNLIYSVTENQNIRFSFSRTIARPSFKEASFAQIIDPITGRTFIGGFSIDTDQGDTIWDGNLTATRINNFDLRWELFQKKGQTVSLSLFYKTFDAPIEIIQFASASNNFQPRNVGSGEVYGTEIEVRQNLGFINERIENFSLNANFTYALSAIDMNPIEFKSRVDNAREGQTIDNRRQMAGQAPYIVNGGVSYNSVKNGLEAGLFYNVQGPTLLFVGLLDRPDIYSVPFHSLNFNANKSFGEERRFTAGFKVSNILDDIREEVFQNFNATDQFFTRLAPRREFSVSLGYSFW
jgi:hypothetical protein